MTDHNEKLIEEARGRVPLHGAHSLIRRLANALEAVEKAQTPTDDEREAQGWREANLYAVDAVSQDDFMTGWRTADRLRRSEVPEPRSCSEVHPTTAHVLPHAEPQGERSSEVPSWDTRVQMLREAVAAQTGSYLSIEGAEAILETVSPKRWGDPSDAEADEAQRGYHAFAFGPEEVDVFLTPERLAKGRDAWKAALRAAGGVR